MDVTGDAGRVLARRVALAVWLSRAQGHCDARDAGDGSPGAANAFKAAGWRAWVPTLALEFGKARVPMGVADWVLDLIAWGRVPAALAPIFGRAFSPFWRLRGGEALGATFGSWVGEPSRALSAVYGNLNPATLSRTSPAANLWLRLA